MDVFFLSNSKSSEKKSAAQIIVVVVILRAHRAPAVSSSVAFPIALHKFHGWRKRKRKLEKNIADIEALYNYNIYSAATRSQICPKSHDFSRIREFLSGLHTKSPDSRLFFFQKLFSLEQNLTRIREKSCDFWRICVI
jgi:hypothetical protein